MQVYGVSVYLDSCVCIIEIRHTFCLGGYKSPPCQFCFSLVLIIDYNLCELRFKYLNFSGGS